MAYMKKEKTVVTPARVTLPVRDKVNALATERRWSQSMTAGYLVERGLEAVEQETA